MIDPYRVLGVQSGVSATELKQAWLRKVRQLHPDTGGDPAKFKEVTAAYEMLSRRGTGQTSGVGSVASGRGVRASDPSLTSLRTSGLIMTEMTDEGLKHLKVLTKLQKLGLSGTQVTDAGLAHLKRLTNLHWLDLGGTHVTDAGLEHLERLTRLRRLGLAGTKVTDEGLKKLQDALPKCKIKK